MNRNRLLVLLAAIPMALAPVAALAAEATADTSDTTTQESSSEGTAAEVGGIATVSGTSASTKDGGSAQADVISLGGQTVVGGGQEGEGSNAGNLVTTGENEQGHLTVAPWEADVDGEGNSSSRAAVADGNLGGEEGVTVTLLESRSSAQRDGSSAQSTGAYVNLGGNEVRLLHAQTSSDGQGTSYLAELGGERIGTNEDFDGNCAIPADPLANVNCLQAGAIADENLPEGADSGGEAVVGDVDVLEGTLTGDLFTGEATQGAAPDAGPGGGDDVSPAPEPAPDDRGSLPRTGAGLGAMLLGALAMGSGESLRRWKR